MREERLVGLIEAAREGIPQTAVARLCATCRAPFLLALNENDRRLVSGGPAPECSACEERSEP